MASETRRSNPGVTADIASRLCYARSSAGMLIAEIELAPEEADDLTELASEAARQGARRLCVYSMAELGGAGFERREGYRRVTAADARRPGGPATLETWGTRPSPIWRLATGWRRSAQAGRSFWSAGRPHLPPGRAPGARPSRRRHAGCPITRVPARIWQLHGVTVDEWFIRWLRLRRAWVNSSPRRGKATVRSPSARTASRLPH